MYSGRWCCPTFHRRRPGAGRERRICVPCSTPFSTCSGPAANGGSCRRISRLGRRCTAISGAGASPASGPFCTVHSTHWPALQPPEPWTDGRHHGWSVGQDERKGGVRGFDGHKRVKGRKRHILVDVLGLPLANRVEPANMPDPVAGARLLAGLASLWPTIRTVIADAGHTSRM